MSRLMTYIHFIKKLKQFHKDRNLENVLREDWSSCKELAEFCNDITSITEAGPEMRFQQKQAEYLALQNQINPHFLYNTLEAIRADALIAWWTRSQIPQKRWLPFSVIPSLMWIGL